MKKTKYQYRVILSSWGCAVDIQGALSPAGTSTHIGQKVAENLSLAVLPKGLEDEELQFLRLGASLAGAHIKEPFSVDADMVLVIQEVEYNECDFQVEALACAVIGLLEEMLGEPLLDIPVSFDASRNRYEFEFPELPSVWVREDIG